jgi:hypothetical protein
MLLAVTNRAPLAAAAVMAGLALASCGSGSSSHTAGATATTSASEGRRIPGPPPGLPTCPTLAQTNKALGVTDTGPIRSEAGGGGIVCEYKGAGNAGVEIFVNQSQSVFAGQVANAGRAPGMRKITGVGDGAYAVIADDRSVVNAYSNGGRTFVAAQAPGPLAPTEAFARIALADN